MLGFLYHFKFLGDKKLLKHLGNATRTTFFSLLPSGGYALCVISRINVKVSASL
jgi:hypothetical protein